MHVFDALIHDITDGDTIKVVPVPAIESLRLARINAPEMNEENGKAAKAFLSSLNLKKVRVETVKKDKYGRLVAEVVLEDGTKLSDLLVEKGFAVYKEY